MTKDVVSNINWGLLIAVFIVSRFILSFVVFGDLPFLSDTVHYSDKAIKLLSDEPYGRFYWPPGNVLGLALFYKILGAGSFAAKIYLITVELISLIFVVLITQKLFSNYKISTLSGWLYVVYPPVLMLSSLPYSHQLTSLCLLTFCYFSIRAFEEAKIVNFIVASCALGLGVLTRPSMMAVFFYVAIIIGVIAYSYKKKNGVYDKTFLVKSIAGLFVFIMILFPVFNYNHNMGVGYTISTNNERNIFLGNNKYTPNYKTWHFASRKDYSDMSNEEVEYLQNIYTSDNPRKQMLKEAAGYVLENPVTTLIRTFNRLKAFWGFDYVASRELQKNYGYSKYGLATLLFFEAGGYLLIAILALVGLLNFTKSNKYALYIIFGVLAYQMPYVLAFSNGFFHFPVMPLLMPFAAITVNNIINSESKIIFFNSIYNKKTIISLVILGLIQIEYAYYLIAYI